MKVRHLCAIIGVAVAAGSVVFMNSLVATNDRQSVAVAERILSEVKVAPDAMISRMALITAWAPETGFSMLRVE